jgi:hypothetical protein
MATNKKPAAKKPPAKKSRIVGDSKIDETMKKDSAAKRKKAEKDFADKQHPTIAKLGEEANPAPPLQYDPRVLLIRKIKIKGNNTVIIMQEGKNEKTQKDLTITSQQPRDEAFTAAFNALKPIALDVLELPDYANDASISGVTFTFNNKQGHGCVFTIRKSLARIAAPFWINTPLVTEDREAGGLGVLKAEYVEAVVAVLRHAVEFIDGKRGQMEMFDDDSKDDDSDEEQD